MFFLSLFHLDVVNESRYYSIISIIYFVKVVKLSSLANRIGQPEVNLSYWRMFPEENQKPGRSCYGFKGTLFTWRID